MASTVRKALDYVRVQPVWLILFMLVGCECAFGQSKPQTPQQTNTRIAELASAARSHPPTGEIPIGSGDLLHIDVFEVPDLSRCLLFPIESLWPDAPLTSLRAGWKSCWKRMAW